MRKGTNLNSEIKESNETSEDEKIVSNMSDSKSSDMSSTSNAFASSLAVRKSLHGNAIDFYEELEKIIAKEKKKNPSGLFLQANNNPKNVENSSVKRFEGDIKKLRSYRR